MLSVVVIVAVVLMLTRHVSLNAVYVCAYTSHHPVVVCERSTVFLWRVQPRAVVSCVLFVLLFQLNFSQIRSSSRPGTATAVTPSIGTSHHTPIAAVVPDTMIPMSVQRTPPSPAQMDPFYTQG